MINRQNLVEIEMTEMSQTHIESYGDNVERHGGVCDAAE